MGNASASSFRQRHGEVVALRLRSRRLFAGVSLFLFARTADRSVPMASAGISPAALGILAGGQARTRAVGNLRSPNGYAQDRQKWFFKPLRLCTFAPLR